MNAQMTGFNLKPNGDVVLYVLTDDSSEDVIISRTMLAGIAEASAEAVKFTAPKDDVKPKVYYVQVVPPGGGKTLTYYSSFEVPVGSTVALPPLPHRSSRWTAKVVGTGRGDYPGTILPIYSADISLSH